MIKQHNFNRFFFCINGLRARLTWKYKMMVHIKPSTTGGLPSTKSAGLMFTNLIFLLAKNCNAVLALLRKCGLRKTLPLSIGFKRVNLILIIENIYWKNKVEGNLPVSRQTELPAEPTVWCHLVGRESNRLSEAVELAEKQRS